MNSRRTWQSVGGSNFVKFARRLGLAVVVVLGLLGASAAAASADSLWATCSWGGQSGTCDSTIWYPSAVTVVWQTDTAPDGTSGCELGIAYHYNSDAVAPVSCSATWPGPTTANQQYTLHIETSSPTASATPSRPPDSNGWYNHALAFSFSGSSFSGIASCTPTATYSGPDSTSATVTGSCTDNAGKTASAISDRFEYEASSPTVSVGLSRPPDSNGWYNHPVAFTASGHSLSGIVSCTSTTYSGPDVTSAILSGSCTDTAGNRASASLTLSYDGTPPRIAAATPSRPPDANGWYNHPVTLHIFRDGCHLGHR